MSWQNRLSISMHTLIIKDFEKSNSRTPSPAPSMGVSTSEQLSRLRKLSAERGQCSTRPAGPAVTAVSISAAASSSTVASLSHSTKPVLRKAEAVDQVEVEGEINDNEDVVFLPQLAFPEKKLYL